MASALAISSDGSFEVGGNAYAIPIEFSRREVYSYRRLLEPIPDIPGGTRLDDAQRRLQEKYFLRRAAACIIPGLQATSLEELPLRQLRRIHEWIWVHRPDLQVAART